MSLLGFHKGETVPHWEWFGCERCFQAPAEVAAESRLHFTERARLIDESHLIVRILTCPDCGQDCISVFTEMIDWTGGDDAQYWSLMPLTRGEALALISQREEVDLKLVESLGQKRRYLQVDYPTGKARRVRWADGGLAIGPHD